MLLLSQIQLFVFVTLIIFFGNSMKGIQLRLEATKIVFFW